MKVGTILIFCCVLVGAALFPAPTQSSNNAIFSQRINGTFVAISGRSAGRTGQFSLIVNGYTAPNQVRLLNEALGRGGQDALLDELGKMDAGRVQIGPGIGVTANAILAEPWGDGGTKLTVFYQRDVRFFELRYGTRSQDYRVGYAEIFLDRNGRGEGTLIPAARVRLRDGNTWEVEDFGAFPARLMGLRASGQVVPR